jgi:hypothetical protein
MASEILLQIELDSESDNEEPKSEKVEVLFQGVRLAEGELFWALNGTKLWPCIIVRNEIDKFLGNCYFILLSDVIPHFDF